ncbi:MAG TPA: GNAT family N-acetyltransferase [Actinomycetota bacterium]|jgi:ribosomal protein S18 acetylase RimI-like enzyme
MEVRVARPEEYEEAGRVTADAYREFVRPEDSGDWDRYLARIADVRERAGRTTIVVAVEDGRVLGSGTLELTGRTEADEDDPVPPDESHLRMLGVDPSARGRGIARAIMAECVRLSLEAGKTLMTLNTTKRMTAAMRMYESLGFERGEDEVFPDGFVLLSYAKRLDRPA